MSTRIVVRLLALVMSMLCAFAVAQNYPSKTVRIVVPAPPGGGTDMIARLLGKHLGEMYEQQVVVDNRPGAGGVIGADLVAKSAPDGYTVLLCLNQLAANHTLYPKLPYDTMKDFVQVILAGSTPNVLVVHPSLPVKSVREFIALAKARPNEIVYASTGIGGPAYIAAEMFKLLTGVQMLHVPYKGAGPALIGIMAGETQAIIAAVPGTVPYIKNGRVRPLGVTGLRRASSLPEVPTLSEAGVKDFEFETWYGLCAPAGTPTDIVSKLNNSIMKILSLSDIKEQFARHGIEAVGGSAAAFRNHFHAEVERLGRVLRASGSKVE